MRGFYPDRWTADTFFAEVVNGHTDPSRVQMDFFMPPVDLGESDHKTLTVTADGVASTLEIVRGGVRSLSLEVAETVLLSFATEPEPARPPDLRSRGCVLAGVRNDQDRQVNLFDYRHYFA